MAATAGEPRAEIRSATITGIVSSAKWTTPRNNAYVASPITIRRQAHAAARSRPQGTWAREKLDCPATTGATSLRRCCSRSWAHWWARRPANRSPEPPVGWDEPDVSEASLVTRSP